MSINNSIFSSLSSSVGSSILGDDAFNILDLFTGGRQGVWYDPSDLATMYQESTGTTAVTADGQPVGLMLDKSRGELFSDVELVTNGTFDTDTSGWTVASGSNAIITLDNQRLKLTAQTSGTFGYVYTLFDTVVGKYYTVSVELVSGGTAPLNYVQVGTSVLSTAYQNTSLGVAPKSYTFTFKATTTSSQVRLASGTTSGQYSFWDNVSVKEVLGTTATQPVATKRPTYKDTPDRLEIDLVDDALLFDIPTGGIDGYMVVGTNDGTASYGVSLPAGSYELGGDYFPSNTINGFLLREGAVSKSDLSKVEKDFVSKGAKESYGDVTSFAAFWRGKNITEFPLIDTSSGTNFSNAWYGNSLTSFPLLDVSSGTNFNFAWRGNNLTSFPLIDTSSGTNFQSAWAYNNLTSFPLIDTSSGTNFYAAWYNNNLTSFPLLDVSNGTDFGFAWYNNNLTSFPLLDTSSGTIFSGAWYGCSSLTSFPANMFDSCLATNFANAFSNTNLSEQSIDNILVSINSNGTSNGTFGQSGGSAPSATGQTAIDAMRSRGWTVTVTGGF